MATDLPELPEPGSGPRGETEAMVRRAQNGSGDGFGDLYRRLAPAIYAWASLRVPPAFRSRIDPEDVVQEVWWHALESLPRFDGGKSGFRPWIFTIATHVLLTAFRRCRVRDAAAGMPLGRPPGTPESLAAVATGISTRVARDEALRSLVDRVRELSEDDRAIFVHCGLEGLTAAQAGEILGTSTDAAAKRWQRVRHRLRSLVRHEDLLG